MAKEQEGGIVLGKMKYWPLSYEYVRRKWKKVDIKWKGELIEEEKTFSYLIYTLTKNNGDDGHINEGSDGKNLEYRRKIVE